MQLTNRLNLPQPICEAVKNDDYSRGDADISVTSLIGPPRIEMLRRKHEHELVEDVAENIYALMGKSIHNILERADSTGITEERMFIEVDGMRISGQIDRFVLLDGILQDYKMCSVWESIYGLKKDREEQLNCYAYMMRQKDYFVHMLQAVMIFRDWQMSKAKNDASYPELQVEVKDIPLWTEEDQLAFIKQRVLIFQDAEINLPECTEEERWASPSKFAVMKEGRKSALRLLDSEEDADLWIDQNVKPADMKKISVVFRPGQSRRCEDYCPVRDFCEQHKKLKGAV